MEIFPFQQTTRPGCLSGIREIVQRRFKTLISFERTLILRQQPKLDIPNQLAQGVLGWDPSDIGDGLIPDNYPTLLIDQANSILVLLKKRVLLFFSFTGLLREKAAELHVLPFYPRQSGVRFLQQATKLFRRKSI